MATISRTAKPSAASPVFLQNLHLCLTSIEFRRFAPLSKFLFSCTFPSRALRSLPLSVMLSGSLGWHSGILYDRGTYGYFWTSTLYSYTYSRHLYFYSTEVNPKAGSSKPRSLALRCVARFFGTPICTQKPLSSRLFFQSSPQPSSFGYDVGLSQLEQW